MPDGLVLDGEILAFDEGKPLPFGILQTRIGRKSISKKILKDAPVSLLAYDLLEFEGEDFRDYPLKKRRQILEEVVRKTKHPRLEISSPLLAENWDEYAKIRENSRANLAEGLMLKHKDSPYR